LRFADTLEAFTALQKAGKIRHYGVSNLDIKDMRQLSTVSGASGVQTNQLLYNLTRRGIEFDLLPWMRERGMPVMAYSPIEQARLLSNPKLVAFTRRHGMTPSQAALAWLLSRDDVHRHTQGKPARARAGETPPPLSIRLAPEQLSELDQIFSTSKKATRARNALMIPFSLRAGTLPSCRQSFVISDLAGTLMRNVLLILAASL
jgi:diketogulonate reductase-like aldo/keto reductase